jgi:hypothetical protein
MISKSQTRLLAWCIRQFIAPFRSNHINPRSCLNSASKYPVSASTSIIKHRHHRTSSVVRSEAWGETSKKRQDRKVQRRVVVVAVGAGAAAVGRWVGDPTTTCHSRCRRRTRAPEGIACGAGPGDAAACRERPRDSSQRPSLGRCRHSARGRCRCCRHEC